MEGIRVDAYRCDRCDHQWVPRSPQRRPKVCPKCKSPYWDRPRAEQRRKLTNEGRVADKGMGLWRDLAPGRSLADELLAERRREAEHE